MKHLKILLCFVCLLFLTACSSPDKDFWQATIEAIESKTGTTSYQKDNWDIFVEDQSTAEDEEYRNVAIRMTEEDIDTTVSTMFFLNNSNDQKELIYIYKLNETDEDFSKEQTVTITSVNNTYTTYQIEYTRYNFQYGNYQYGEDANGMIYLKNKDITYDNVPLLKEAIESSSQLIESFQDEFNIDYNEYDFSPLPSQMISLNIPQLDKITEETATLTKYYGEPHINAKGFSLIDYLTVDKYSNNAYYSSFNVERQSDDQSIPCILEQHGTSPIYTLVPQTDIDLNYLVYLTEDTAYLYSLDFSNDIISEDVENNSGQQAEQIFKTTNENYDYR